MDKQIDKHESRKELIKAAKEVEKRLSKDLEVMKYFEDKNKKEVVIEVEKEEEKQEINDLAVGNQTNDNADRIDGNLITIGVEKENDKELDDKIVELTQATETYSDKNVDNL